MWLDEGLADLQVDYCAKSVSLETKQKDGDYSASLEVNADFVHHMFIYTRREKKRVIVSWQVSGVLT